MSAHRILARLTSRFAEATSGYADSVDVFDGPAGFTPTSTLSVAVGVRYNDESPIWVDPTQIGAADRVDDDVTIWCIVLAALPSGNSIADARELADSTLLDLDRALAADPSLDGECGLCYITGAQRWLQGYTPDGPSVSVEFQVQASVYR